MSHHVIEVESLESLLGRIEEKREPVSHSGHGFGERCERPDLHRRDPRVFLNDKREGSSTSCWFDKDQWVTFWCHPTEQLKQAWRDAGFSDSGDFGLSGVEYYVRPDGTHSLICTPRCYIGSAVFTCK